MALPLIELDGSSAVSNINGLNISAGNSKVLGLDIDGFGFDGLILAVKGGNVVQGTYLGINAAGTAAKANGILGLLINGSANNMIGGTSAATRNVISGNANGLQIYGSGATGNVVLGNYIGADASGTTAVPNGNFGILIKQ